MIWARLSLSRKLFVAVVLPVLFAVLLMAAAISYVMREGFSQYLLESELAQLDDLVEALEQHPEAAAGWPSLSDPQKWRAFILQSLPPAGPLGGPMAPPPPQFHPGTPPPGINVIPRPRPANLPSDPVQLPLPERLSVLSAEGIQRAGPSRLGSGHADHRLLDAEGTLIGFLRLTRLGANPEPADRAFLRTQFRAIAIAAAIALLCASLVAYTTARQFLAPIRAIGLHVARLAAGDLDSRLNRTRADELGRMMADHDTLAESLSAVRRREKQWIADTSHELKTPLAVLRAQIEALQDGIRPSTPQALESMHHAVMRLSRLTDDLSLLSRSDAAQLPLTATTLDVRRVLCEAIEDAQPRAEAAGLALQIDDATGAETTALVYADPVRLRQVFDNLLENACRYTDPPGRIRLACERRASQVEIIIEDTAPCPPAAALPQLFDRFRRGETSRARSHGGSGLGLSICRALLSAQNGEITAAPSPLGGLRITITLPTTET